MGLNASKRLAAKCAILTKEEQGIVSNSFKLASRNSERVKEDDLVKVWGPQMDARLSGYIKNYLFGTGDDKVVSVDFDRYAQLFVFCTRGNIEERLTVLLLSLGKKETDTDVSYILVKEYVESIVSTYMKLNKIQNDRQFKTWNSRGAYMFPQNVQRLAESLSHQLAGQETINREDLERWIAGSSILLGQMLFYVFNHLYSITVRVKPAPPAPPPSVTHIPYEEPPVLDPERDKSLIPFCRNLDLIPTYPSILDFNQIVFINAHLPEEYRFEWRFLFSSEIHGESFSTLIGRIMDQGPTVIIVEDQKGYTFGGFAPAGWSIGPKFFGDSSSILYTLAPRMRIFNSTGYNQNYQYLNLHQQTMPNGLMMGGQHGYCGLFLDSEYGDGHTSETCTTFSDYFQMSHDKNFKYRHLEVWGVGPPPPSPEEKGERIYGGSVLDGNHEGKAILKMAGRNIHSEGLREPPQHL